MTTNMEEVKVCSEAKALGSEDVEQLYSKLSDICQRLEDKGEKVLVLLNAANNGVGIQLGKDFFPCTSNMLSKFQQFCDGQEDSTTTNNVDLTDHSAKLEETSTEDAETKKLEEKMTEDAGTESGDDVCSNEQTNLTTTDHDNITMDTSTEMEESHNSSKGDDDLGLLHNGYTVSINDTETNLKSITEDISEPTSMERRSTRLKKKKELHLNSVVCLNNKSDLKKLQTIQKSNKFVCSDSSEKFTSSSKLKDHSKLTHKTGDTDDTTHCNESADKHREDSHREGIQYCKIMDKTSEQTIDTKQTDSVEQKPDIDSKTQLRCLKCKVEFSHVQHLKTHQRKIPKCETEVNSENKDLDIDRLNIVYKDSKDNEITIILGDALSSQTKEPYKCVVCKVSFNRRSNLKRHLLKHSDFHQLPCNICGVQVKNREIFSRHMKEHNEKPFQCEKCDKQRFETEKALVGHLTRCVKYTKEDLTCSTCGHVSKCRAALEIHLNVHLGVRLFPCEHCGKKLATSTSLERHIMSMHQEETPFECEVCHRTFKVRDNYKKHLKHHEEPRYKCEICGKACVEFGNLKKHMMSHTKEKPFVCEICGNNYSRRALLDNHMRLHTGEKPYKCKEKGCGKAFRSYANLKQHSRYHSDETPYVCDVCGKAFKQPTRMTHHRKGHFVEYRWPCAYCTQKFKTMFLYKSHLAKCHPQMRKDIEYKTNIKLYQCHICQKTYGDKEDLVRHYYIHDGLKPFKCDHCSRCFNDKSNLKQHMRTHQNNSKFNCHVCEQSFVMKKSLRAHICSCHGTKHLTKAGLKPIKPSKEEDIRSKEVKENKNVFVMNPNGTFTPYEPEETHVIVEKEPNPNEMLSEPRYIKINKQSIIITETKDESDNDSDDMEPILPDFKLLQQPSGDPMVTMDYHSSMNMIG